MPKRLLLALILALFCSITAIVFAQNRPVKISGEKSRKLTGALTQGIEAKLGNPLTLEQRQRLGVAYKGMTDSLTQYTGAFNDKIAFVTKLPSQTIGAFTAQFNQTSEKFSKDIISKIEVELGRPLASRELKQIQEADQRRKKAIRPIIENFTQQACRITGLSEAVIKELLSKN